jgi:hypothetical protein
LKTCPTPISVIIRHTSVSIGFNLSFDRSLASLISRETPRH